MLRRTLLMLSRSDRVKNLVSTMPVSSGIVARFVAGETVDDAVAATRTLVDNGRLVTLDHLGEDTLDRRQAHATVDAYLLLLERLADSGPRRRRRGLGQALGRRPGARRRRDVALDNARAICEAAAQAPARR